MSQYAGASEFAMWGLPPVATADVPASVISAHLEAASSTVDSYIAARGYDLPLTTWGVDVTQAVCRIAAWSLLTHYRGVNPDDPAHEALSKANDSAVAWLLNVSKGNANLSVVDVTPKRRNVVMAEAIAADTSSDGRGW